MNSETLAQLSKLSPENRAELKREADQRIERHVARNHMAQLYPPAGLLRRELYTKHMEFFAAGAKHQERAFIAANRTGKTTAAGFELTCHLTGIYPEWWDGRRFDRPTSCWGCGTDAKSVRETIQVVLFGRVGDWGTGMIPHAGLLGTTARSGTPEGIDSATIKHKSGGKSRLVLKGYDQGREAFQGAKIDSVWMDEEPPRDVYTEALTRTMSTVPGEPSGIILCTFTPLLGMSEVVQYFLGESLGQMQ